MIPRDFQYYAPNTVKEAVTLLKRRGSNARILAGGMSLVPLMKLRLTSLAHVIDINRISEMEYVRHAGKNKIVIGALTRHHSLESSKLIKQKLPLIAETASWIGDPQVRNMGTIGGSLSHCDPSGDWGATALALRAEMKAKGPGKERIIRADDFFVDTFRSALKPSELLTEVRVTVPSERASGSYAKLERKAGDFATVGVAVQVSMDPKGVCTYAGIGLTALGPKSLRAKKAEDVLRGKELTLSRIEEAGCAASEDAQPTSDPLRGSAEYKKAMAAVFTRRALTSAMNRIKGGRKK